MSSMRKMQDAADRAYAAVVHAESELRIARLDRASEDEIDRLLRIAQVMNGQWDAASRRVMEAAVSREVVHS